MKGNIEFDNDILNKGKIVEKDSNDENNNFSKFLMGILLIVICVIIVAIIIHRRKIDDRYYEALTSNYEIYCESKAYIVNNEQIVDFDNSSTIVTLAKAYKRIALGDVIAMYKTKEYDNNIKKLQNMDSNINSKLTALPKTYSNEIVQVENEINDMIQDIKNTSSYIEINEYKSKLDELSYKKAKILASLTPSGEEVLSLISEREAFKSNMNDSNNNIKAPVSGIVVYKHDGLENKFESKDFSLTKINEIKKAYDLVNDDTFGIKIVDNFESYIIVLEEKSKEKYMSIGNSYEIELLEKDSILKGTLAYMVNDEASNNIYCIFRVTNNVEDLVDLRTTDVKVTWKRYTGYWVNNTSLTKKGDITYVTILSLNEYIEIPVKVITETDTMTLVNNYTKTELENLGIERTRSLILYDRIVKDLN